ncbi:MAG TPA: phage tail tape measure protein, partial [Candidatus Pacearchaeota archaeon]|nr:phage tail tape measure protein [Candidatus Pacearchaeota archaeon]
MTLNEQLQRMKSIMTDIEKQSIPAIKDSIIDLAKTYGLSMEELGSSMYEILSSNFNPEFATKILEGSTKMATAGLSTLQEAVSLMITSINAYGYSMDDITTLSDAFFEAVKVGRFTIGELGEDFATAATTAAIFGIDIREVLTALATMTNQGIKTNEAITALNRLMINFASGGSAEAKKIAKELGIEMNSNAIKAKGLAGLVRDLNGATEEQIVALTGSVRAFKAMASVMADVDRYEKFSKTITNSMGATDKALAEIQESQSFRMKKYKQEFIANMMNIADEIMPVLLKAQKLLTDISKVFGGWGAKVALSGVSALALTYILYKMVTAFRSLAAANAQANVQLGTFSLLTKTLGKAGVVGAIAAIASTAIATIWQLVETTKKAKKEMDILKIDIEKSVNESVLAATASQKEAIAKYQFTIKLAREYVRIAKDETESTYKRKNALDQLKKTMSDLAEEYPANFEKLDTEKLKLEDNVTYWNEYEKAINLTTAALEKHLRRMQDFAKLSGYTNLITKYQEQINNLSEQETTLKEEYLSKLRSKGVIKKGTSLAEEEKYWSYITKFYNIGGASNFLAYQYTNPPQPVPAGVPNPSQELIDIYYRYNPFGAVDAGKYFRQYKNIKINMDKALKKQEDVTKLMDIFSTEMAERWAEKDILGELGKTPKPLPTGRGDTGGGKKPAYDYQKKLKLLQDRYQRSYELLPATVDYKAIAEKERTKEQDFFQQAVDIIQGIEKEDDRDKATIDLVKWMYDEKKKRLTTIMSLLKKQMEKETSPAEQEKIKDQMADIVQEMLVNATQYQAFDLEEFKKNPDKYLLPKEAAFGFENKELIKLITEEDEKIIEDMQMSIPTYTLYQKIIENRKKLTAKQGGKNAADITEEWVKATKAQDYVTADKLLLELQDIAKDEKDFKLDLITLTEMLQSEKGLTKDQLAELGKRVDLLSSGLWASELEYLITAKGEIETTLDKYMREYTKEQNKNLESVKLFLEENELITNWEDLTVQMIDDLLLLPLPEEVKSALEIRKKELQKSFEELDKAHQEELKELSRRQQQYYEDIDSLLAGKGTAKIFSIGVMKLLYM